MKPSPTLTFLFLLAAPLCAQTAPAAHRCYDYPPSGSPIEIPCPAPTASSIAAANAPFAPPVILPPAPSAPVTTTTTTTTTTTPTLPTSTVNPPSYPASIFMVGASYSQPAAPHITGWLTYAPRLSASTGLYSYSTYDVSANKQRQLQSATTTGLGIVLRQYNVGPTIVSLVLTGNVGAVLSASKSASATSASATTASTSANVAAGGTGGVVVQFSKTSQWSASAWVDREQLSTGLQTFIRLGVGYSPK